MKYSVEQVKRDLYSGVISDVLDILGYRNQAIGSELMPLSDDTVIFGPAFTSIGTQVYSMPENPLIAQCRVVDQLKPGEVYLLVTRGKYTCAPGIPAPPKAAARSTSARSPSTCAASP